MRKGFATIAVIGIVAVATVLALTFNSSSVQSGMNLNVFSDSSFNRYLAKHGKSYGTKAEYLMRKEIHDKALEEVTEHNQKEG